MGGRSIALDVCPPNICVRNLLQNLYSVAIKLADTLCCDLADVRPLQFGCHHPPAYFGGGLKNSYMMTNESCRHDELLNLIINNLMDHVTTPRRHCRGSTVASNKTVILLQH